MLGELKKEWDRHCDRTFGLIQGRECFWSKSKDGVSGEEAGRLTSEFFIEKRVMLDVELCQEVYLVLQKSCSLIPQKLGFHLYSFSRN